MVRALAVRALATLLALPATRGLASDRVAKSLELTDARAYLGTL